MPACILYHTRQTEPEKCNRQPITHTHLSANTAAALFSSLMTYCLALERKRTEKRKKEATATHGCDQPAIPREGAAAARKGVGGVKSVASIVHGGGWRGSSLLRLSARGRAAAAGGICSGEIVLRSLEYTTNLFQTTLSSRQRRVQCQFTAAVNSGVRGTLSRARHRRRILHSWRATCSSTPRAAEKRCRPRLAPALHRAPEHDKMERGRRERSEP